MISRVGLFGLRAVGPLALLLASLTLTSCDNDRLPVEPLGTAPQFAIKDGAHGSGNQHFYFLPPLVPQPTSSGVFDATRSPIVQICEWTGSDCSLPLVAEFTMTSGPGSEIVRVVAADDLYVVNWHTGRFALDVAKTYRIRVLLGITELGHADVDLVATRAELRKVKTSEYVRWVNGAKLPIKFRIEQGAISAAPRFSGVLRDRDGTPLPNQYVYLSGATSTSAQTGADGSFSLSVAPNTYSVGVYGYNSGAANIPDYVGLYGPSLTLSADRVQDLTLQNVLLRVTVLDPSGNPVPNTSLRAYGSTSFELFPDGPTNGSFDSYGSTDASGVAQLPLLTSSSVTVIATPPAGLPQTSVTVSVLTDASITIRLGGL